MEILCETVQLPDDVIFNQAVQNVPGAEIRVSGLRVPVVRFQQPDQAGEPSVRSGVFYLPVMSRAAFHYKGKNGYGGTQRVSRTITLRRPLFVKAATGGKGPERAYDSIKGLGAYKAMRGDLLDTVILTDWGRGNGSQYDALRKFYREYNVRLDPGYALSVSTKGNQLAYAIQEAVVAYAVRKAGYDSIVSWGMFGKQPVITEIFLLKERNYPTG